MVETLDYSDLFSFIDNERLNSDILNTSKNKQSNKAQKNKTNYNNTEVSSKNIKINRIYFNYGNCLSFDKYLESNENEILIYSKENYDEELSYSFLLLKVKPIYFNTDEELFSKARASKNKKILGSNKTEEKISTYEEDCYDSEVMSSSYWVQRYYLFSKFDEGIKLDKESKFSTI